MSDPRPRSGLRLLAASLFVAGCSLAVWWPVTSLWWSSEDLLGLTGSRTTGFIETLRPQRDYPFWRPLWSAHIKLCESGGWPPGVAHLSVLLVHTAGLLLLLAAAVRAGLPVVESALGCALAGAMVGNADALAWFAAGNKAWSFVFGAGLVLTAFSSLRPLPWAVLLAALQALAMAASENSLGNAVLVPALLVVGVFARRIKIARVAIAAAALTLPSLVHLLAAGGTGHAKPILLDPARSLANLCATTGTCLRHAFGLAAGAGGWTVVLAATAGLGLFLRSGLVVGAAAAVALANVPAGFLPDIGKYHAYLPSIAAGLLASALVFRCVHPAWRRFVLAGLLVVTGLCARQRIGPFQRHFARLEAVASALRTEWPAAGTVGVLNLPLEFTTAFAWVLGSFPGERVKLWAMITTRATCARPPTESGLPPPVADAWFEFDGLRLVRTTWDAIDGRRRAPAIWLTDQTQAYVFPEATISEVLAERRPLEEANLVVTHPRLAGESSPPGTARLSVHRVVPEKGYEWEVEADLTRPGLLVLTYVPLPLLIVEFLNLVTFVRPVPPPLRVEVTDAGSGERCDVPVYFVATYFPALLLPKGTHRLKVLGLLPWVAGR